MSLLSVLRIFLSSLEAVANLIIFILQKNTEIVDMIVKTIAFICHSIADYLMSVIKIFLLILQNFMQFAIELSHALILIFQTILHGINNIIITINISLEMMFNIIFIIFSFVFAAFKSLFIYVFILFDMLKSVIVLIFSSIGLFIKSLPIFCVSLYRHSFSLCLSAINYFTNIILCAFKSIYCSVGQLVKSTVKFIQEIPTDIYLGTFILFVLYAGGMVVWKYDLVRYITMLPQRIHILFHFPIRNFYHYFRQLFSPVFNYNINVQQGFNHMLPTDNGGFSGGNFTIGNQNETRNDINNFKNKFKNLRRKSLKSDRFGKKRNVLSFDDDSSEEEAEMMAELFRTELDKERDKQLCVVCQVKSKNVILLPCRHLCICEECHSNLQRGHSNKCPLCRKSIQKSITVYL
ncbi:uncharacterized protein LOC111641668 [Centruroides sculpturatus]|uniref:uncharacterized protein LOC111641668 n=1 Tax=Centruroides sculpturatus TaxID=218467 RepID=UPI000C6CA811|nr:uncharacterized protein LOC111641668 [Centruroides sculpturatus]